MSGAVNLRARAAELTEHWSPRVVAEVNGRYVKVAKLLGEFVWHTHEAEDELFQVLQGRLVIQYEGAPDAVREAGDIHVVPRGVRRNPVAAEECLIACSSPRRRCTPATGQRCAAGASRSSSVDPAATGRCHSSRERVYDRPSVRGCARASPGAAGERPQGRRRTTGDSRGVSPDDGFGEIWG